MRVPRMPLLSDTSCDCLVLERREEEASSEMPHTEWPLGIIALPLRLYSGEDFLVL